MFDIILHFLGICPDHLTHFNLIHLIPCMPFILAIIRNTYGRIIKRFDK